MALILGKIKCCFCNKKDGVITSVCSYGSYGDGDVDGRIFYHEECLQLIEAEPEKFGHRSMDKAIDINSRKKRCNNHFNNNIITNFKKKVEKLNSDSFERMMPTK